MDRTLINSPVDQYASRRDSLYASDAPGMQLQQLPASWSQSRQLHKKCRDAVESAGLTDAVRTVAVSGSLGRMEVVDGSDCDLIVVLSDQAIEDTELAEDCFAAVLNAIEPVGLAASRPGGIFSFPTSQQRLCDPASLGIVDEDMATFGHRIQLLIDSQPIFGDDGFRQLQSAILQRYATATIQFDNRKQWTYLLNDLIRYHRSLCVRTQWVTRDTPAKWRVLNLKLHHSRMINYIGLLFLLGECSTETTAKQEWLLQHLKLTPLERVVHVLRYHEEDARVQTVIECYDRFLSAMNSQPYLASLKTDDPTSQPNDHDAYQQLRTNGLEIVAALTRFVFESARWDPRFAELLLF